MEFLAIIPARYASTRLPGKPLVMIGGKSMIQRVYEQASLAFENVYVATDHPSIHSAVEEFGGRVVMTSTSHPNGTSRALEAMHKIEKLRGVNCKYLINVQGDEPFVEPNQLLELASCFSDPNAEVATLVKEITDKSQLTDPSIPKVVFDKEMRALYFSRSPIPYYRDLPIEEWLLHHKYYKHIGLYGYKRDLLPELVSMERGLLESAENLEQLRWLENGVKIVVKESNYDSHSVDTPHDIELLQIKGLI